MDYNFDEPILCNFYDTFSPDIDPSEKYKFISTSELHFILKDSARPFALQNGWLIDLFSENTNYSFDTPKKVLNLLESYALSQTSTGLNDVGSSEWIYFKKAQLSDLPKSDVASITKKALADIANLEDVSNPNDILTHICKAIISPDGLSLPFFENVLNNFVQKNILLSPEKYASIPCQSVDIGLNMTLQTLVNHKILNEETLVGILTPAASSFLEVIPSSQFNFKVNCISVEENGMILETEFEKLKNDKLTVLIISSVLLSQYTVDKINKLIVELRQELIIIQDASLFLFSEKIPRFKNNNTISLFSFSKFFGSGHSIVIVPTNNVIDSIYLPSYYENDVTKAHIFRRYLPANNKISKVSFAHKIMYDGVCITGRETTSIISFHDQILLCLLSTIDYSKYHTKLSKLLTDRVTLIKSYLGIMDLPQNSFIEENKIVCNFYLDINFIQSANLLVGKDDFGDYIFKNFNPYELFTDMAENFGIIIKPGSCTNKSPWDIRLTVASLTDEECGYVGSILKQQISKLFEKYKDYLKKVNLIKFGI